MFCFFNIYFFNLSVDRSVTDVRTQLRSNGTYILRILSQSESSSSQLPYLEGKDGGSEREERAVGESKHLKFERFSRFVCFKVNAGELATAPRFK